MTCHARIIKRFNRWAEGQGGVSLPTNNEYELTRVKHADGTFVIYRNKKDAISFSDSIARRAWQAFNSNKGMPLTVRQKRTKTEATVKRLTERDGDSCFFCARRFCGEHPPTLEHLLSIAHGGNNTLANLALACAPCNQEAGSMDIAEKINLRDQKRIALEDVGGMWL